MQCGHLHRTVQSAACRSVPPAPPHEADAHKPEGEQGQCGGLGGTREPEDHRARYKPVRHVIADDTAATKFQIYAIQHATTETGSPGETAKKTKRRDVRDALPQATKVQRGGEDRKGALAAPRNT